MIISGEDIIPLIGKGIIDQEVQKQPAGIDLTARRIGRFMSAGSLDFTNNDRRLPDIGWMFWEEGEPMVLDQGSYLVEVDPIIEIPMDAIAFAQPRSSLTRMGCGIHSGIWDPGYKGDSVFVLNVYNREGLRIYKHARIAQLVYARMESPAIEGYDGIYQGHGIKDIGTEPPRGIEKLTTKIGEFTTI